MPVMGKGCLILNLVLVAEIVLYLEVGRSGIQVTTNIPYSDSVLTAQLSDYNLVSHEV